MSQPLFLPRSNLLGRLRRALRSGHLLVEAPSGYGKSMLAQMLAAHHPNTHHVELKPGESDFALLQPQLESWLNDPTATVIVDDAHLLADDLDAMAWLAAHLERSAGGARLVLLARTLPLPNRLALQMQGRLTLYGPADLALTQAEAALLGVPPD